MTARSTVVLAGARGRERSSMSPTRSLRRAASRSTISQSSVSSAESVPPVRSSSMDPAMAPSGFLISWARPAARRPRAARRSACSGARGGRLQVAAGDAQALGQPAREERHDEERHQVDDERVAHVAPAGRVGADQRVGRGIEPAQLEGGAEHAVRARARDRGAEDARAAEEDRAREAGEAVERGRAARRPAGDVDHRRPRELVGHELHERHPRERAAEAQHRRVDRREEVGRARRDQREHAGVAPEGEPAAVDRRGEDEEQRQDEEAQPRQPDEPALQRAVLRERARPPPALTRP